jgi:hypothetical protein
MEQSPCWEVSISAERTACTFRVTELLEVDALEPIEFTDREGKTFLRSVGTFSHHTV